LKDAGRPVVSLFSVFLWCDEMVLFIGLSSANARRRRAGWWLAAACLFLGVFLTPGGANSQQGVVDELEPILETLTARTESRVDILLRLATAYLFVQPPTARNYANEAIEISLAIDYDVGLINGYRLLGLSYHYEGNYQQDIIFLSRAFELGVGVAPESLIAETLRNMGTHYYYISEYGEALDHFLDAKERATQAGDDEVLAKVHFSIADVFIAIENYDEAKANLDQAFGFFQDQNNTQGLAAVYDSYGKLYEVRGEYRLADEYYRRGLVLNQQIGSLSGQSSGFIGLASVSEAVGDLQEARDYLEKAMPVIELTGDIDIKTLAYAQYGRLLLKLEEFDRARGFLNEALSMAIETGSRLQEMSVHEALAVVAEVQGQYQQALYHVREQYRLRDIIYPQDYSQSVAQVQAQYIAERRESEINQLRVAQTMSELEAERDQARFNAAVATVIFVLFLSAFLWTRYRTKSQSERQIAAHNTELVRIGRKLERANRVKSDFLANTSHEIRTPLNGIIGMTTLLRNSDMDEKQRARLKAIEDSGHKLLELVNDLLDLSKIEAGKIEMGLEWLDLRKILKNEAIIWKEMARSKGLGFELNIDPKIPSSVCGTRPRLSQVLNNLVGNAVKFTTDGSIRIMVELVGNGRDDVEIKFCVIDTGVGISDKHKIELFERFSQIDTSATRQFQGTGLGLAICRDLVELMDGRIGVESEEGEGSCFWILLPFKVGSEDRLASEPPTPSKHHNFDTPSISGLRILVAEDNEINQRVVCGMLEYMGHETGVAADGREAFDKAKSGDYDVVFMDIQMPGIDGEMATKLIRESDREFSKIPIVAVTANAMVGDREKYLAYGMNDYLAKPIDMEDLRAVIARMRGRLKEGAT
jgi:signal transduction histidine kinase/ActR/RegA family two-component response regulator